MMTITRNNLLKLFKPFLQAPVRVAMLLSVIAFWLLAPMAQAQPLEKAMLWKIEGNGLEGPSYLFGTIHMLPQEDFALSQAVQDAFAGAENIVLELDMDNPALQAEMMQHANAKGGKKMTDVLTEEEAATLDAFLQEKLKAPLTFFNGMKPFMAGAALLPGMMGGQVASYELSFVQMAKEQEKDIQGLETVADQLGMFDRLDYEEQVRDLLRLANEYEAVQGYYARMVEVYKENDVEGMYNMVGEYYPDDAMMEILLWERNRKWVAPMGEFAGQGGTFFAVGSGHLGGSKGVIALLRQEGYTVTPVE